MKHSYLNLPIRILFFIIFGAVFSQKLLIPMDQLQTDHLKAYGVAFWSLKKGANVDWLLNYRGGSFLVDYDNSLERELKIRGVYYEPVNTTILTEIFAQIEENNMDMVLLEKLPKIAVYSPPDKQPWDDAVTLALTYAEIDYEGVFDDEVLADKLQDYDWLHLHHEDFTGQYGKFYKNYHNALWYRNMEMQFKATAQKYGFISVHELKKQIAVKIRTYI